MAPHTPLVSACIPVYNHRDYVWDAVQSVIDQDYDNVELIVIDDGSLDDSAAAVEPLLDVCRARFCRFEFVRRENRGLGATLNQALEWSQGQYFSALASDDMMLPAKTSLLVGHMERHPNCGAVFGQVEWMDSRGRPKGELPSPCGMLSFRDLFTKLGGPPAPAQLIRMEALRRAGMYRPDVMIEDLYMWLAITAAGYELEVLPAKIARYREHPGNTSKKLARMLDGRLQVIDLYRDSQDHALARCNAFLMTAHECLDVSARESLSFFLGALRQRPSVALQEPARAYVLRLLAAALRRGARP